MNGFRKHKLLIGTGKTLNFDRLRNEIILINQGRCIFPHFVNILAIQSKKIITFIFVRCYIKHHTVFYDIFVDLYY